MHAHIIFCSMFYAYIIFCSTGHNVYYAKECQLCKPTTAGQLASFASMQNPARIFGYAHSYRHITTGPLLELMSWYRPTYSHALLDHQSTGHLTDLAL